MLAIIAFGVLQCMSRTFEDPTDLLYTSQMGAIILAQGYGHNQNEHIHTSDRYIINKPDNEAVNSLKIEQFTRMSDGTFDEDLTEVEKFEPKPNPVQIKDKSTGKLGSE